MISISIRFSDFANDYELLIEIFLKKKIIKKD